MERKISFVLNNEPKSNAYSTDWYVDVAATATVAT